ncbi:MAG: ADP-ribosylglycohydrolase family protein [Bacteroidota bacterium]
MKYILSLLLALAIMSCESNKSESSLHVPLSSPKDIDMKLSQLDRDKLYDKMLGMLAGSAIGDAMGAPTEMWARQDIQLEYGHVDDLDDMVREPSAEGIWDFNMQAGSTTDDTRWKVLLADFLTGTGDNVGPHQAELGAKAFADHLINHYSKSLENLKKTEGLDLEPYEDGMRRLEWLKEWIKVAKPYSDGDIQGYSEALSQFYGGEMVCAGMLFAPILGAYYPGDPDWAYKQTYEADMFDLGYGRDISGLTAAMVAEAFKVDASPDSILHLLRKTDPKGYFKSRLVGRTSYKVYQQALRIAKEAKEVEVETFFQREISVKLALPLKTKEDSVKYAQWSTAYQKLDNELMRYPFHPSEIFIVNHVALLMNDFDFVQTLSFVINYGRDNDTTAAVTGAILGAYWGAGKLPEDMLAKVIKANLDLGYDLEKIASRMTQSILAANS